MKDCLDCTSCRVQDNGRNLCVNKKAIGTTISFDGKPERRALTRWCYDMRRIPWACGLDGRYFNLRAN